METDEREPESKRRSGKKYETLISQVFFRNYQIGSNSFEFSRNELEDLGRELGIPAKNLGDIVYSYRYRRQLPEAVRATEPKGEGLEWRIENLGVVGGETTYRFVLAKPYLIEPTPGLIRIKIPDSTPGIIAKYARDDEQALLAKLRYNRLLDIFTGAACYSLQNHLRTQVKGIGQIEIDEVYVGVNRGGIQYVLPVQAKGGNDKLGIQQIEQDLRACKAKFPSLECIPVAAQFMDDKDRKVIALFAFAETAEGIARVRESHYILVQPDEIDEEDLAAYRRAFTLNTD